MRPVIALLAVALASAALPLVAADPARTEPVHLRANRIEIDQKRGVSRYLGRVSLRQGALQITAARAEARGRGGKLEFVTATGAPLTFRDQPAGLDRPIEGVARRLEYEVDAQRLHLYEEVDVHQGNDRIRSGILHYDIPNRTVTAESDGKTRVYTNIAPRRPDDLAPGLLP